MPFSINMREGGFIFVFFISLRFSLCAQNLVPNPSFENVDCSKFSTGFYKMNDVIPWRNPTKGLSSYFNSCIPDQGFTTPKAIYGYQVPRTGNAYAGIIAYEKYLPPPPFVLDYIQVKLDSSLKPCVKYNITFYVSLADTSGLGVTPIGAYVSDSAISRTDYSNFPVTPQVRSDTTKPIMDTVGWTKISGNFIAKGGEQYLTIGNFSNDVNSKIDTNNRNTQYYADAYYYVDDVSVTEIHTIHPKADAGKNVRINEGEVVTIGTAIDTTGIKINWQPVQGLNNSTVPQPLASPSVTTTYTLTLTEAGGCTSTSTVTVAVWINCNDERDVFIPNVFSPNNDGKNDVLAIEGNGLANIYWGIYDRWGNLVFEAYDNAHSWDGTKKGNPVEAGVYSYYLRGTCVKTHGLVTLKGNVTLVK